MKLIAAQSLRIPALGLGTWDLRGSDCARLVTEAMRLGYRHIDTAQMYGNEAEVGEGLRASGVPRTDIFVTTKIWPSNFAPADVTRSHDESLSKLKLDDVDLLLLHWPNTNVPLADTLGALSDVKRAGKTRQIGVSNFTVALLDQAVALSPEPLVCNQFEIHPFLDQSKVIAACRRHSMAVTAYSPIAKGSVRGDHVLERIGKAHGKTAAQISLRYLVQQDIVAIPRSSKVERLKENIGIFDFELTAYEMKSIAALSGRDGRLVENAWSPQWDRA